MVAVPAETPEMKPLIVVPVNAVAIAEVLLLQVPPAVVSVKTVTWPAQTIELPKIGENAFTIVVDNALQPVAGTVYDIITVPDELPVTIPVPESTVAIDGTPLLHTPP
jgi:hypothetical protein